MLPGRRATSAVLVVGMVLAGCGTDVAGGHDPVIDAAQYSPVIDASSEPLFDVGSHHDASDGGGSTGPTVDASTTCMQAYSRALGCDPLTVKVADEWLIWCEEWSTCHDLLWGPQSVASYWACANARLCGTDDDAC